MITTIIIGLCILAGFIAFVSYRKANSCQLDSENCGCLDPSTVNIPLWIAEDVAKDGRAKKATQIAIKAILKELKDDI